MSRPADVRVTGPLAPHARGFREALAAQGYATMSAANQLRVMAHLSRWLGREGLCPDELTPERAEAFLQARRAAGYTCWLSPRGLSPLLGHLRGQGVAPVPIATVACTPLEEVLAAYRTYLVDERGLASTTVRHDHDVARLFLATRCRAHEGELVLAELTAAEVAAFVVAECSRRGVGSAKNVVTGLRSLLRFLHVEGRIPGPLASAVPAVRGKGRRQERLPLPADVGQAIVAYLRRGRPSGTERALFLRVRAPHGRLTDGAVKRVVPAACDRAGLPRVGAHRLRHSVATEMLRAGAPLAEVGQLLRHRSLSTTAIYAKVDRAALRGLALPWPGGAA